MKVTIRRDRYAKLEEELLIEQLRQYDGIEIYKMKERAREDNGEWKYTGMILLTFNRCQLPETVKIGWISVEVRKYILLPRRCFKCQQFNHSIRTFRSGVEICITCGVEKPGDICQNPVNCANCDEPHPASDKSCRWYTLEK